MRSVPSTPPAPPSPVSIHSQHADAVALATSTVVAVPARNPHLSPRRCDDRGGRPAATPVGDGTPPHLSSRADACIVSSAADGNAFVLHGGSQGVYASAKAAAFIRFEKVAFRRTPESAAAAEEDGNRTATVTAVIFEAGDHDAVGGADVSASGGRALCCTPDMARLGACTEGATTYRARNGTGWPSVLAASFLPAALEATFPDETVSMPRTGMYTLLFVHCDASLGAGSRGKHVAARGKTIWKNSRSYLPGRMAPLLPFYGAMSLPFAALAAYWFAQCARFWRDVVPLQSCATLVIALGMLDVATWYFDLAEFNDSGVRPRGATFWAATSGALRGAVARVLVLAVAMGHGVLRPALKGLNSARVVGLGAAFFAAAEALEVSDNVGTVSDHSPPPTTRLFLALPVAALNAVFVYWIFSSLAKTLNKLKHVSLSDKLPIPPAELNLYRAAVALRLVLLAAFLPVPRHQPGAPWLWLAALVCELWLAVAWLVAQLPKLTLTNRETHLDRLASRYDGEGGETSSRLGSVDVLLTAAGAGREPPLATANTVPSVLVADDPARRLACYVSDDGADLLLFEAARFTRRRVPFCRRHAVEPRAPELYFTCGVDYLRDRATPSFVKERRAMKIDHS